MTLKKFSIFTSIIVGIMIITTVVLACIKVDGGLGITPDRAIVYLKSTSGTQCDASHNTAHFDKIVKYYKDMTKLSIADYMFKGKALNATAGQDYYNEETDTWSTSNKQENYCLELTFKEKQSIIVTVDGNTKVVDFYGLIMVLKRSVLSQQVALYFSTVEDFEQTKSYSKSPILINANQTKLVKYLQYMEKTFEENEKK